MIYFSVLNNPINDQKTHHYGGSLSKFELMSTPDFLIIEKDDEETNGFFLYRYTLEGEFVGDTWHPNLEEAKEQAEYEYENTLEDWKEMPNNVQDYPKYVIDYIKKN